MSQLGAQLIREEEGPSQPRAYRDSRGFLTISMGTCVDPEVACEGLCQAAMDAQDAYEIRKWQQVAADLPGYQRLNSVRQAVCDSMCFQMGTLSEWPRFKACLALGDFAGAADNMLYEDAVSKTPSRWFREDPKRCAREAYMMRSGVWLDYGSKVPNGD